MNLKFKRSTLSFVAAALIFIPFRASAFTDGSGWAIYAYIVKIWEENVKHYMELQSILKQGKSTEDYLRFVNQGIDDSIGLIESLPVKDEKILSDMKDFKKSYQTILDVYGKIPKSSEEAMQKLHDQTIAESLRMVTTFKDYSESQERNSKSILIQSHSASPKGAARMQAQTSAEILSSLSQLIRLNTQMLKLQSEQFAMTNRESKASVSNFQTINGGLGKGFDSMKLDMSLKRF